MYALILTRSRSVRLMIGGLLNHQRRSERMVSRVQYDYPAFLMITMTIIPCIVVYESCRRVISNYCLTCQGSFGFSCSLIKHDFTSAPASVQNQWNSRCDTQLVTNTRSCVSAAATAHLFTTAYAGRSIIGRLSFPLRLAWPGLAPLCSGGSLARL